MIFCHSAISRKIGQKQIWSWFKIELVLYNFLALTPLLFVSNLLYFMFLNFVMAFNIGILKKESM